MVSDIVTAAGIIASIIFVKSRSSTQVASGQDHLEWLRTTLLEDEIEVHVSLSVLGVAAHCIFNPQWFIGPKMNS